jgi:Cof subfamily protein (haloacid dehalogenase superfamily)
MRFSMIVLGLVVAAGCGAPSASLVRFPVVYTDLDGTALGSDGKVRPATKAALDRFRRCGGRVGIATGRVPSQVRPVIDELKPDLPLVLYNGAVIADARLQGARESLFLEPDVAAAAHARATRFPGVLAVVIHMQRRAWASGNAEALAAYAKDWEPGWLSVVDDPTAHLDGTDGPPVKVVALVDPAVTSTEALAEDLARVAKGSPARAVTSSRRTAEVVHAAANKGDGIRKALKLAGIPGAPVVAFGDSGNDVEMLSTAAVGVAMGNCRAGACEAALLRAGGNDTDAISDVIRRVVLAPGCPE